jgi:hypothetical protein
MNHNGNPTPTSATSSVQAMLAPCRRVCRLQNADSVLVLAR